MKLFNWGAPKKQAVRTRIKEPAVKDAAYQALHKYEKTFIDLARYDRGEQLVSVSH